METISANRRIRNKPQPSARCAGSKKGQSPFGSCGVVTDGFLRHQFLPLYEQTETIPDKKQVEAGVFSSLSRLAESCSFQPINVADKPYPYNVLLAYWDATQQINDHNRDMELFIVTGENGKALLSTKETVDTGQTLYYIPVLPLCRLLKDKRQKRTAELLLSVFAYLYHVAAIPYYRDSDSYLFYHYEVLEEWMEDEADQDGEQDHLRNKSALQKANHFGDVMERKIFNLYQLNHFKERADRFNPKDDLGKECLKIARTALDMWDKFLGQTIYGHINNEVAEDGEEDEEQEESIRINEYISFIAETEGSLYDSLSEIVNSEFQEKACIQKPMITTLYNQSGKQGDTLDFERQLFALILGLCTLLNELP